VDGKSILGQLCWWLDAHSHRCSSNITSASERAPTNAADASRREITFAL